MSDAGMHPLETILRQCAGARPEPWYPSAYAQATGISRDSLDPYLDQLRLGGLIHLTDWVQGHGQGYALTPAGEEVVESPKQMARLLEGKLPRQSAPPQDRPEQREMMPAGWERGEAVRDALLGSAVPRVTLVLIFINIMVFVAGLVLASQQGVAGDYLAGRGRPEVAAIWEQTGALSGADVYLRGQWWRLVTCCFVHIGWVHLLVNMFSLYVVGPLLERMWGHWRFLLLYLITGFGGSCGMLIEPLWSKTHLGIGAGASGALWGILGSMVTWIFLNRHALPRSLISDWTRQLMIVFVLNIFITFFIPNISKGAHFGGGIVGLLTAIPLDYLRFGRGSQRWLAVAGLIAIPLVCLGMLLRVLNTSGEQIRRANVLREAAEKEEREERQFEEFNDRYLPRIRESMNAAQKLYQERAEPLLQQESQERDPATVKDVVGNLAQARTDLTQVVNLLDQAGPFSEPLVEKARQVGKEYLGARIKVFKLTEQSLEKGKAWTPQDEKKLEAEQKELKAASLRWEALFSKT